EEDVMNVIAKLTSVLFVSALCALIPEPANAAPQVSCATGMQRLTPQQAGWLNVVGARLTARGVLGFSAFTMADGYQVEKMPLHTPAAGARHEFKAYRYNSQVYTGFYHEVFPSRGNGDEDRWEFWVNTSGQLWLKTITWGGSWKLIPNVTCYDGPQGQLVMSAHVDNPGFGTDFLLFVMNYDTLI